MRCRNDPRPRLRRPSLRSNARRIIQFSVQPDIWRDGGRNLHADHGLPARHVSYLCRDARGADSLAEKWAKANNVQTIVFPADWRKFGNAAGPMRNQRMLDEGKPDLVIAFPGGRGTADMVQRSRAAGVEVMEVK